MIQVCFSEWLERVRTGEQRATTEFVRRYEPAIRRVVRLRLSRLQLGRVLDDRDICQAVLGQFFANAAAGRFAIDTHDKLQALLTTMARNKVQDEVRKHSAVRRHHLRVSISVSGEELDQLKGNAPTPSRVVGGRELVEEIQRRFTDEERQLFHERSLGHGWAAIASGRGVRPEAVRKKLTRALNRVFRELGLVPADAGSQGPTRAVAEGAGHCS
jgi:DNA-directed RNA polymerase specialized sigma24 family protein